MNLRSITLRLCWLLLIYTTGSSLDAQVIWFEPFNYGNGATSGTNQNTANPSIDWTASCATCQSGDWFEVRNGLMEGRDTNGPAVLETESIDISNWAIGVQVSVTLSKSGVLEGCPGGVSSGCNSVDWIRIEYDLDGAGYQDYTAPTGGPCSGACAGATYVTIGDFNNFTFTACPIYGDSIRLRISVQCWSMDEYMRLDNILVEPQSCNPFVLADSTIAVTCAGDADGQVWINASGAMPPYTYSLNGGPFQSSPGFTGLAPGLYTAIVQDANGAFDTLSGIMVNAPQPLALVLSSTPAACGAPVGSASVTASGGHGGYTYLWNTAPPQTGPNASGLLPGTYVLTLVDSLGCTASDSIAVGGAPPPTLAPQPDSILCPGGPGIQLQALASGQGPFTYAWSCDQPSCGLDTLFDDDPIATPGIPTTYFIQVTDANGCPSAPDTLFLDLFPEPVADAGPDIGICPGDTTTLSGTASGASPPYTYQWTPAAGLSDPSLPNPLAAPAADSYYSLTVSSGACSSQPDSVFISLNGNQVVSPVPDTVVCQGDSALLSATVTGPPAALSYQWYGPAGLLNPDGQDSVWVRPSPGSNTYTLIVDATPGCASAPYLLNVFAEQPFEHPRPESLVEFCPGEPLEIGVEAQPGYSYAWTPRTGPQDFTQPLTQVAPQQSGAYSLLVTSLDLLSDNCKVQSYPVLLQAGDCLLPNVFSPNGDGINDALNFGPYYNDIRLTVYDRWGTEVYHSAAYQNDWQGQHQQGGDCPEGVYYYVLEAKLQSGFNGQPLQRSARTSGAVTLVR